MTRAACNVATINSLITKAGNFLFYLVYVPHTSLLPYMSQKTKINKNKKLMCVILIALQVTRQHNGSRGNK